MSKDGFKASRIPSRVHSRVNLLVIQVAASRLPQHVRIQSFWPVKNFIALRAKLARLSMGMRARSDCLEGLQGHHWWPSRVKFRLNGRTITLKAFSYEQFPLEQFLQLLSVSFPSIFISLIEFSVLQPSLSVGARVIYSPRANNCSVALIKLHSSKFDLLHQLTPLRSNCASIGVSIMPDVRSSSAYS